MELKNLPDISFAETDAEIVKKEIIARYETIAGRTLADGDPVRLFLLSIAELLILQRNLIDYTGKMNLLAYSKGDYLDHLGALLDVERIPAKRAETTLTFVLSTAETGAIIPEGTRVTTQDERAYFATAEALSIPAGQLNAQVAAICTEPGDAGNHLAIGSLTKLVDPLPYVDSVKNATVTAGGADKESDESYRERIHEATESFSDAGSYGAYAFFAKSANPDIADVFITSPSPGEVKIVPLMTGGEIPEEEVLKDVLEACNAEKVRPLTDHVTAEAPTKVDYEIEASYFINADDRSQAAAIQKAVGEAVEAYKTWQSAKLGRDLDPSKLYELMVKAGARKVTVTKPALTKLTGTQVAATGEAKITYKGAEDE